LSKLITTSLIGSINWFQNAPSNYSQQAYLDLKSMLGREKYEMNEYAKRGIEFERMIYDTLKYNKDIGKVKCSDKFKEFLLACKNGTFQSKVKFFLTVSKIEYCIYGKIDVLFKEKIIDIKTTAKWDQYSENKYLNSFQHKFYCFGSKIPDFEYMIAVFDGMNLPIVDIKHINYHVKSFNLLEVEIITKIKEVQRFLDEHEELLNLYNTTYSKY